jgi:O-antigen/teichoic acid export membrane protein
MSRPRPHTSLRISAFSAVRWTALGSAGNVALRLLSLAVLARLLSPEDYGLMAMVAVVLGFGVLFSELGLSSAFVQRQDVTQEERSSLFWLGVATAGALTGLIILFSPVIASFFQDDRLSPLVMLASLTIVIGAMGRQVRMAAEKSLRFVSVVVTELVAGFIGFIIAVIAALNGFGVYSLVFGSLVSTTLSTLFAWIFIANGWRPLLRMKFSDVRSYLGFGGAVVVNGVVNTINRDLDLLLGGRMLMATQLGFYSVPRTMVLTAQFTINPIITRVGFPLISKIQDDIARVRRVFLMTLNMIASAIAPLYLGMSVFAPEIVDLLLGGQWQQSAELLRVLAVWGFLRGTSNPVGSLTMGLGRVDLELKYNLGMLVVVAAFLLVGSQYGPTGLAWALLALALVNFVPLWFFLVYRLCHAGFIEYATTVFKPATISLIAVGSAHWVASVFDSSLVTLTIAVAIAAPMYLALSYYLNRAWFDAMLDLAGARKPLS